MADNPPLQAEIDATPCPVCDVETGPCVRTGHPSRIAHPERIRAAVAARLGGRDE